MSTDYTAEICEKDAAEVLEMLRMESDLQLVSYGEWAVDLQLLTAPSPHAVHLEASYAEGRLRLSFHMNDTERDRHRQRLIDRARARGITLELALVPA